MGNPPEFSPADRDAHQAHALDALQAQAVVQGDAAVLSAVNQNTELLQQLVIRLLQSKGNLEPEEAFDEFNALAFGAVDDNAIEAGDENIRLREVYTRQRENVSFDAESFLLTLDI